MPSTKDFGVELDYVVAELKSLFCDLMRKTIVTRVIVSNDEKCYRLHVKVPLVQKMMLSHLQKIKVTLPDSRASFMSKITASGNMDKWRINVPVLTAREAGLKGRTSVKTVLETI